MVPQGAADPLLSIQFPVVDRVRTPEIQPAIARLLEDGRARAWPPSPPPRPPRTFDNTMQALDELTEPLDYAMGVVRHLESVATTPELRAAFNAVQPEVSAFYSGIPLDEGLWKSIKTYAATPEAAQLDGRAPALPAQNHRYLPPPWRRSRPGRQEAAGRIDVELTQITTKFAENVLDSTNAFELVLTTRPDLAGLAAHGRGRRARERAPARGVEGWRFTLQAPDYFAVMTYLDDARHPPQGLRGFTVRGDRRATATTAR